jgi:ABC-type Fe3+/spermidine/putrescine transport system ATPase subunit
MDAPRRIPVRVESVRKRFASSAALDGVTLDFPSGSLTTLLGPSGCGKTTLLRVIAGFVTPDEGRVFIGDEDRTATPPWRRRIGFVFQSYALWPHMTVFDNVAYGLTLRRLPRPEIARQVEGMLSTVGLEGLGGRAPGHLSGGQQQRVALARALVLEPDVLLLDEPLANLDARLRAEMRRELRGLQRRVGITTVFVTHDQEEALELSDRVAVMHQGRVAQYGPPDEVWQRPASAEVAAFLGSATVVEGRASDNGDLVTGAGILPLALPPDLAGKRVRVSVAARRYTILEE